MNVQLSIFLVNLLTCPPNPRQLSMNIQRPLLVRSYHCLISRAISLARFRNHVHLPHSTVAAHLHRVLPSTLIEVDGTFAAHQLIRFLIVVHLLQLIRLFIEKPHRKHKQQSHQDADDIRRRIRVFLQIHVPSEADAKVSQPFERHHTTDVCIHIGVSIYISEENRQYELDNEYARGDKCDDKKDITAHSRFVLAVCIRFIFQIYYIVGYNPIRWGENAEFFWLNYVSYTNLIIRIIIFIKNMLDYQFVLLFFALF